MRGKLIGAIAISAIGSSAYAQSSMVLYGGVDGGLSYQSTSAATLKPGTPNLGAVYRYHDGGIYTSMFGLKGSEDLGGGLRANFRLQGGFDSGSGRFNLSSTTGSSAIYNQIATVGLSGPFGSFDAGRQFAPIALAMGDTDVRAGRYFGSTLTAWVGMNGTAGWSGTNTNAPIGALYDDNAIVYQSPSLAGASLALEYVPGGTPGNFQAGTRESAVLKYSNYGLKLAAAYYNGHDTNPGPLTAISGVNNNRYWYVGGLYATNGFSVSASYSNGRNPAASNVVNLALYTFGLGYRFTPTFQITSDLLYLKDRNNSTNKSTEVAAGAEYFLSKTTLSYLQVGWVNNRGTASQPIVYGQLVAPGMATTAVNIGIRHMF